MKEDQQPTSSSESEETLTNRQGHPVTDNQNMRTVGNRGPTTLENYDFLEKISHFDRERIPERVVHARGAGAHGYFEAYGTFGDEPISTYTRAKLFQEKGKKTLSSFDSLLLFTADIHQKLYAIHGDLRSNFIQKTATGILLGTTSKFSLFEML